MFIEHPHRPNHARHCSVCACVRVQTSLAAMSPADSPRSSVFTFESRTHCLNVLGRLDEQRHGDRLCDVTVEVDGQSFRAHRAVLTACSEYFDSAISKYARQGAVLTLPPEVR